MQENTNFADIRATVDKSRPYNITLTQAAKVDNNIRLQGEEIESGEAVLKIGQAPESWKNISLLANLGVNQVNVFQPLVVGVLATGDELVAIGNELQSLAQVYNLDTPTLKILLSDLPITIRDYGIIPDNVRADNYRYP